MSTKTANQKVPNQLNVYKNTEQSINLHVQNLRPIALPKNLKTAESTAITKSYKY